MLSFSQYLDFEWAIVGEYAKGLLIFWPPWAGASALLGGWLNRHHSAGPRWAGALGGATLGALAGIDWQYGIQADPSGDLGSHLSILGRNLLRPVTNLIEMKSLDYLISGGLIYAPILLALLLYVLARRHEEGIATFFSRLRERRAERRQARAERRALVPAAGQADFAALPSPAVPATGGAVVTARPGEAVALPGGLMVDGEAREGFIVINVVAPSTLPRFGRGSLSGFFVGTYYAAATVSKLWLPLALVGLWLFWAPLLAYAEQQAVAAGTDIGSRVVKQLKWPWG